MNIRYLTICCLLGIYQLLGAQTSDNKWHTYLACYNTTAVAEANNRVYAMADGTLYSYGKDDNSVSTYSRQTGLSDSDVKLIAYNNNTNTLVIVYDNGNIDLYNSDGIYNLPYLKNATNIQDKTPNEISFNGENAYLSTNFGIVSIDLKKKEIAETYKLEMQTYSACVQGTTIYAATANGLYQAAVSDNLLDVNNWKKVSLGSDIDETKLNGLASYQNRLYFCVSGNGLYYIDSNGTHQQMQNKDLKGLTAQGEQLMVYTSSGVYIYFSTSNAEYVASGTVKAVSSLKNDNKYWIAAGENGLIGIQRQSANNYAVSVAELNISSPKRNYDEFMTFENGKLLIAGGGFTNISRGNKPGTLMTYENGKWTNFDENSANKAVGYGCQDYTGIAVDPDDANHYFVSTFGEGVIEIKDNTYVQHYSYENTPLKPAITTTPEHYVRVNGICYDKDKNLWMTNCDAQNGIVVRTADGKWQSLYYAGANNATIIDQILISSKGYKWVNVQRSSSPGILVFDDNGTPTDNSDDTSNFYTSFRNASNSDLSVSTIYCMAEDQKGEIWMGTNSGPMICASQDNALNKPSSFYCSKIIRTNDSGNEYFLNNAQINAIAVDGGNRKWIGTDGAGLFLINADGSETIHEFTTDNSPLLSNTIQSIAINSKTGEVFIGTDKGLISYRSDATEANESYSDVYAYPNPVRPEFDGSVTITGLMGDSNVKITDLNGNLIYQAKSAGGQLSWNCRAQNGNRVASGIYLVLASTPQGKESIVTKIAIVK